MVVSERSLRNKNQCITSSFQIIFLSKKNFMYVIAGREYQNSSGIFCEFDS